MKKTCFAREKKNIREKNHSGYLSQISLCCCHIFYVTTFFFFICDVTDCSLPQNFILLDTSECC